MSNPSSPSSVLAHPSNVRPTSSSAKGRRNTGFVQPVQPVQPISEDYRVLQKQHPRRVTWGELSSPRNFFENYVGQAGLAGHALFFNALVELYVGQRLDEGWTTNFTDGRK